LGEGTCALLLPDHLQADTEICTLWMGEETSVQT
jgi:hypothetical protein